ncbi:MAG TPA: MFS transporter [Chloroflexota bacterium]|nr:MFS transporter [Chloroflexota bacterium]
MTSARLAVSLVFFLHGIAGGMWAARIPAIQANLALGVGTLGLALLGGGLGTLLVMLPTGALIARRGSRLVARWLALPVCIALVCLALATDAITLFAAMILWGASAAALDVAMNAQGATIEQRRGRPIMSSLHGLWSVGNMSGAVVGAFVAGLGISVRTHFLVAAPVLWVALVLAPRRFTSGDVREDAGVRFALPRGSLLALAAVAFCAVMTEGAMFDWAAVFLRRELSAPEATAALAPSFFSAAMAAGRLGGDQLTARVRAPLVARLCAAVAAVGIAAMIFAPVSLIVFGGLVGVGLGLSVLVPLAFGAAGRSTQMPTGTAIAAVATVGYFGFLVGPPTIGLVAEQVTLRGGFVVLLVLLGLIAVLAPAIES